MDRVQTLFIRKKIKFNIIIYSKYYCNKTSGIQLYTPITFQIEIKYNTKKFVSKGYIFTYTFCLYEKKNSQRMTVSQKLY